MLLDGLSGTTPQAQAAISDSASVSGAAISTQQSFGFNSPGLLSGTVYADTSSNSDQDGGEAGLVGVVVTLTPPSTVDLGNGLGQPVTTLTDSDGSYEFSVVQGQTYTVSVASPGPQMILVSLAWVMSLLYQERCFLIMIQMAFWMPRQMRALKI